MDVFRLNSKRPGMDKDSSMLSVACLCSIEFESHLHIFEKRKHACALTHAHIHTHTHTSSKLPCCHAALLLNCCDGMLAQECRPGGKTYTHTHTRTHRSAGQGGKAAEWRAKDLSVDHKPENDSERRRILMCKGRVERTRQVGHVHTRLLVYVHEFSSCAHMNVRVCWRGLLWSRCWGVAKPLWWRNWILNAGARILYNSASLQAGA
eukprot:1160759-Pelagomonas_calceolata.AAC.6